MNRKTWRPGPRHPDFSGQRPVGPDWILVVDGNRLSRRYVNDERTMGAWWKRVAWWIREVDLPADLPAPLTQPDTEKRALGLGACRRLDKE